MLLIVELEHLRWWVSAAVDEVGKSLDGGGSRRPRCEVGGGRPGDGVGHWKRSWLGGRGRLPVGLGYWQFCCLDEKYRRYQKHECG